MKNKNQITFVELCDELLNKSYRKVAWKIVTECPRKLNTEEKIEYALGRLGIHDVLIKNCIFIAENV